jgi:hypothetical protein
MECEHQTDHRYIDKSFAGFRQAFIILAQAPLPVESGESALHNPAFGQHPKTDLIAQFLDNLQGPTKGEPHPVKQSTPVAAIGPEELQTAPTGNGMHKCLQQQLGAISVLDIPSRDKHQQH